MVLITLNILFQSSIYESIFCNCHTFWTLVYTFYTFNPQFMSLSSVTVVTYYDENGKMFFQSSIYESIFCNIRTGILPLAKTSLFQSSIYESIFCNMCAFIVMLASYSFNPQFMSLSSVTYRCRSWAWGNEHFQSSIYESIFCNFLLSSITNILITFNPQFMSLSSVTWLRSLDVATPSFKSFNPQFMSLSSVTPTTRKGRMAIGTTFNPQFMSLSSVTK